MATFVKPKNLNGIELREELRSNGINISDHYSSVMVENDELILDIPDGDKDKAASVVAVHDGTIIPLEPTVEDKLASVGLNLSDLKQALGL